MRAHELVVILAACGAAPPAATPSVASPIALTGTITDHQGNGPIEGVTIVVLPAGAPDGTKPIADAVSDARGGYRIGPLSAGRYDVHVYYLDIAVVRTADVRGPTVVDQEIDGGWTSGAKLRTCADATSASCK
jgi:hypothetical protein